MSYITEDKSIIEMFTSIAGEGQDIGTPSIFIRFSGCNVHCPTCDSKFTWEEQGKFSLQDAIEFISHNPSYPHVELTGGEVLLYKERIRPLLTYILSYHNSMFVTIETNGTISPTPELIDIMNMHGGKWSVSPKVINNKVKLSSIFDELPNTYFKFIIDTSQPILPQIDFIESLPITKTQIILQPDNSIPDYINSLRTLTEFVISNNLTRFRVIPQVHFIMWPNQRGK